MFREWAADTNEHVRNMNVYTSQLFAFVKFPEIAKYILTPG